MDGERERDGLCCCLLAVRAPFLDVDRHLEREGEMLFQFCGKMPPWVLHSYCPRAGAGAILSLSNNDSQQKQGATTTTQESWNAAASSEAPFIVDLSRYFAARAPSPHVFALEEEESPPCIACSLSLFFFFLPSL